jgi:hypothetical protein
MIDIYKLTESKVKQFVMERLEIAEHSSNLDCIKDVESQAYGAIQFTANNSFPACNWELIDWWDEVVKPKFKELM